VLPACAGVPAAADCADASPAANPGYARPTATTASNELEITGAWREVGPADWSCRGPSVSIEPLLVDVRVTGVVFDPSTGDGVAAVDVVAYHLVGPRTGSRSRPPQPTTRALLSPDVDFFDQNGVFNPRQDGVKDSLSIGVGLESVRARFIVPSE
jgi:hypothetical protein